MIVGKVVPHMTDIVKILKNESYFRCFLLEIQKNKLDKKEAANLLMDSGEFITSIETAKRYVGSLRTYSFILDKGVIYLSEYSIDYLNNNIRYSDYILSCLSRNLEWSYFLLDIYAIVDKHGPSIKKKDIISYLINEEYHIPNKKTVERYLSEILPILDLAEVIRYENNIVSMGNRDKKEVTKYAGTNKRELLNILLMAEKRRIRKSTFRKIYGATVKAYLPVRKSRLLIQKTQDDVEKIRSIDISKSREKEEKIIDSKWELKDPLWDWQEIFLDKWIENKKGIAKVVTGAGKTHLAMAIIQKMKANHENLHVTIIVPTIVLLEQWFDNLVQKLQISPDEIGLRGGGYSDTFRNKKIFVIVINSAVKDGFIEKETIGIENNLLIVDECHRAGSKEFRKIFNAKRSYELGLSATPEREMDNAFEDVLEKELGSIIRSYTYIDALEDNIIPNFNVYNYAVILNDDEKRKYLKITKEIQKIIQRLKYKYPFLNDRKVKMEVSLKTLQKKHPADNDLFLYFQKTKERKNEIVYPAENRQIIVKKLLNQVLSETECLEDSFQGTTIHMSKQDRVIVFHEIISEINSLFYELDSPNVSIYHSGLPHSLNRIGLDLYKSGQTKVLLSVKALIEGVDVPKTNVGIIMASSASQTQRIQSLGRVLRKAKGKDETKLIIIYVKNTTDERVYYKTDWDEIIGKGNIDFKMWTEFGDISIDPPQIKQSKRYENLDFIDENTLEITGTYPGNFEGKPYSFDSNGQLFQKTRDGRSYINKDLSDIWQIFKKYRPSGGKLLINELGHILIKEKVETIYLGNINSYGTWDKNHSSPFLDQ